MADEMVCATTPSPFFAVGASYWDFDQTTDERCATCCGPPPRSRPPAAGPPGSTRWLPSAPAALPTEDGAPRDDDLLFELVGDARFVLSARRRTARTSSTASGPRSRRRLIEEKGFTAVAVEADWPDAYRVNRYVRGARRRRERRGGAARLPALPDLDVAQRRRARLRRLAARAQRRAAGRGAPTAGFYGLDLYSLHASIEAVLAYLDKVDPEAARAGPRALRLLRPLRRATRRPTATRPRFGLARVVRGARWSTQLRRAAAPRGRRVRAARRPRRRGRATSTPSRTRGWSTNAEEYYRTMFRGRRLVVEPARPPHGRDARRAGRPPRPRAARPAEGRRLGAQLAPRRRPRDRDGRARRAERRPARARAPRPATRCLVGFTTYTGTVTAARRLGRPGRAQAGAPGARRAATRRCSTTSACRRFLLDAARRATRPADALREPRLERAIGVIYRPETERQSHYFHAAPGRPVRRRDPLRRDARRRAAGADGRAGRQARRPRPTPPASEPRPRWSRPVRDQTGWPSATKQGHDRSLHPPDGVAALRGRDRRRGLRAHRRLPALPHPRRHPVRGRGPARRPRAHPRRHRLRRPRSTRSTAGSSSTTTCTYPWLRKLFGELDVRGAPHRDEHERPLRGLRAGVRRRPRAARRVRPAAPPARPAVPPHAVAGQAVPPARVGLPAHDRRRRPHDVRRVPGAARGSATTSSPTTPSRSCPACGPPGGRRRWSTRRATCSGSSTTTACSGSTGSPQWYTVVGGSRTYVERLGALLPDVRAGHAVTDVTRRDGRRRDPRRHRAGHPRRPRRHRDPRRPGARPARRPDRRRRSPR